MLSIDGRLLRGAVELHLRASDWTRHGHDGDPAYDEVILHAVYVNDLPDVVRTFNGSKVPTLELHGIIDLRPNADERDATLYMAALGSRTCLPTLSREAPQLVRAVLRERGWQRLVEKQLRFSQELQVLTAPEALYRGLLDALGYSANRQPMAAIGQRLPLQLLERFKRDDGVAGIAAALIGTGGFLPLAPANQELLAGIADTRTVEGLWESTRGAYALEPVRTSAWTLNRVRPSNHPVARLAALAALIGGIEQASLFEQVLGSPLDGGKTWDRWLATARPPIGEARRRQIIVNIFAPFLAAYAEVTRDDSLTEQVAEDWERLGGNVSDHVARRTRRQIVGDVRFPIRLALEEQGLHEIHRSGCSQLRCFECPIARLASAHEPWDDATA